MQITSKIETLFLFVTALSLALTGCGDSNLDNPKTYQKTVDQALGEDELEKRQEGGEELLYRKDDQTPYTGWFAVKWNGPGSSMRVLAQYKDGRKDGPFIQYDEMWNEQLKGHYKDGKKDGFWSERDPAGDTLQEGHYKDGKKDGPWTELLFDDETESGVTETTVNHVGAERMAP